MLLKIANELIAWEMLISTSCPAPPIQVTSYVQVHQPQGISQRKCCLKI